MAVLLANELVRIETVQGSSIIYSVLTPGVTVTLEVAKKITADRLSIWGETDKPLVVDVNGMVSIEDAARDYWATAESMRFIKAVGIITNKKFQVMIANFFIRFSRPAAPTKLFTGRNEALKWCEKFC